VGCCGSALTQRAWFPTLSGWRPAYIGISYAIRPPDSGRPRFVTCCSQVFDAEGSGLEFVAYDAHEVEVQRDNPFLSRTEMFRVMTRSLDLYRRRHAGRSPRRVMVHKTTEFKPDEIDGSMEAFHLCETVDLVQVIEDVAWRGVRIDPGRRGTRKGRPAAFPVSRGTVIGLGPCEALLWTRGMCKVSASAAPTSRTLAALLVQCVWSATPVMDRGTRPLAPFWDFRR
jgi:hypothetical protein